MCNFETFYLDFFTQMRYCSFMKHNSYDVNKKIKILGVAPYDGMKTLIEKEAKSYKNVEIKVVVGNLQEGVKLVQSNFHANYDAIISRGGTADALRECVEIPVIEIPLLNTDLLKAIRLSEDLDGKKAIVGFSSITDHAKTLCDILQIDIDIFTLIEENDVYPIMKQLEKENYKIILCDVISGNVAKAAGLLTILITSSAESINIAITNAVRDINSRELLRNDNLLLRTLLDEHTEETVLYGKDRTLYFSSITVSDNERIFSILEEMIDEVKDQGVRHYVKSIDGYLYSIKSNIIETYNNSLVAFFFTKSKATKINRNSGVSFYSMKELEKEFLDGFYHLTGNIDQNRNNIRDINKTNVPIIIQGEYGTGKTELANYIYINSEKNDHSFIEIDCDLLNIKSKEFLLNNHRSPLFISNHMVHFKNMEANPELFMKELLSTINHLGVCKNNKVIFSYDRTRVSDPIFISYIKDKFQCIEIELRPIRENKEQIPAIANLYLSHQNARYGKDILRFDRNAMSILVEYPWPNNYVQFERILSQLIITAKDNVIREADVRNGLSLEKVESHINTIVSPSIPLKGTLADIEKEIISQALKDNNGNQSITAKQLGISRTTLWRILQNN